MPVKIRNKSYNTVNERITAIHEQYAKVSINTEILGETELDITVKATLELVLDDCTVRYTGLAREHYEMEDTKKVNFAFALENAETSAVGRALAHAGYGGDEKASAEEMARITEQTRARESQLADDKPVVKPSGEPEKVPDKASGNGKELPSPPISSLSERKKAWTELTVEAKNRNKGSTEVDGKNVDTWKVKVREKLEDMYGPERSWTEKTPPAATFEATELYAAYTELFPDLVDEE